METEVLVLGVCHHFHAKYEGYSYWHVRKIIDAYQPDLVFIEVSPRVLAMEDFRCDSPEKWGIALAWARKHQVPVEALDNDSDFTAYRRVEAAEQIFSVLAQGAHAELERRLTGLAVEVGGFENLFNTYEKANSPIAQETWRKTHRWLEELLGEGPQTGNWTKRNTTMLSRIIAGIEKHKAQHVIVCVGAEHKYALDEMLGVGDVKVMQLPDFLNRAITLAPQEITAFRRGDHPIIYPNDLMLVHRSVHGGEPTSYMFDLNREPSVLRLSGILKIINSYTAADKPDPNMLFYRGIYYYNVDCLDLAVEDLADAATNRAWKMADTLPLWEVAKLRQGQVLDLLGRHEAAVDCYLTARNEGCWLPTSVIDPFLERPFTVNPER